MLEQIWEITWRGWVAGLPLALYVALYHPRLVRKLEHLMLPPDEPHSK